MPVLNKREQAKVSVLLSSNLGRKTSGVTSHFARLLDEEKLLLSPLDQKILDTTLGTLRFSTLTKKKILSQVKQEKLTVAQILETSISYSKTKDVFSIPKALGIAVTFFLRPNDHFLKIEPDGVMIGCCLYEGTGIIREFQKTEFSTRIGLNVPFCHRQVSQLINLKEFSIANF